MLSRRIRRHLEFSAAVVSVVIGPWSVRGWVKEVVGGWSTTDIANHRAGLNATEVDSYLEKGTGGTSFREPLTIDQSWSVSTLAPVSLICNCLAATPFFVDETAGFNSERDLSLNISSD